MSERTKTLLKTVALLASDASVQLEYLKKLGIPEGIDELALEYDAIAGAAEDMLRLRELDKRQYDAIKKLDDLLSQMSGKTNSKLWTIDALSSAPEWEKVRYLAKQCLLLFES